jgi:predicted ATP-grasp superfamily ATP-dependent carboligase
VAGLTLESAARSPGAAPKVLFVALDNYLGIERFPSAMGALGADCAIISPPGFYPLASRFIRQWYPVPAHRGLWLGVAFIRHQLEKAVRNYKPDLLIPLDDISAQYLRVLGRSSDLTSQLRDLLERSFGAPEGYAALCSRTATMDAARSIGIRVPKHATSRSIPELLSRAAEWGYPVVLKSENSCGGHGVTIARTAAELSSALKQFYGGPLWRQSRRAAISAFWHAAGLVETAFAPPLLQTLVPGVPAMRTVSAWRGEVLEGVSFIAEKVHPEPTGSSTLVRHIDHAEMAESVRRFVAAQGCSGFLSFDFMLDMATGQAALIEINARPIATTHLGQLFGQDPCAPLLARIAGTTSHPVAPLEPETRPVALFPKELIRNPHQPDRLRENWVFHDVPYDDPAVLQMHLAGLRRTCPDAIFAIEQSLSAGRTEARLTETTAQETPAPPVFAANARFV